MALRAIIFEDNELKIINQLELPHKTIYETIGSVEEACDAIKKMKVRGAPAIAIVGLLSLSVELGRNSAIIFKDHIEFIKVVNDKLDLLINSRPTAVNISNFCSHVASFLNENKNVNTNVEFLKNLLSELCEKYWRQDLNDNLAIGNFGANFIIKNFLNLNENFNILTHCNTGSLATTGYGTALGVVRRLKELGRLNMLYFTETRPYLQGARLTAYEVFHDKIPGTLIVDSCVGLLMQSNVIHAVIVGADRVSFNGDVANKIGTLQLAILAKHYGIPFYVATPWSSIDKNLLNSSDIVIEERPASEMRLLGDRLITSPSTNVWNPAFDITPGYLITGGLITEKGVIPFDKLKNYFN